MWIDARAHDDGQTFDTTVCIVGGGPAGLTLAMELGRHGIDVIVLESGGLAPDAATTRLLRGTNRGLDYEFGIGYRSRFFGGGSNCWGGMCRPFESHHFESRPWVPDSGWPFGIEELRPYYERAHRILQLGPFDYEAEGWVRAIDRPFVRRLPLDDSEVTDGICQFGGPTRFDAQSIATRSSDRAPDQGALLRQRGRGPHPAGWPGDRVPALPYVGWTRVQRACT